MYICLWGEICFFFKKNADTRKLSEWKTPPIDHLFTVVKTHFRDQMLCCLPVLS